MIRPLAEHDARAWLRELVALYEAGLREPLPLPVKTSLAWAEEFRRTQGGSDGDPDARGRAEWTTPRFNDAGFPKEDSDVWHVRAFGEHADYDLLASPLRAGEGGPAPHRLGHYAWRLWSPLLDDRTDPGVCDGDLRHRPRPRARHHPARGERRAPARPGRSPRS